MTFENNLTTIVYKYMPQDLKMFSAANTMVGQLIRLKYLVILWFLIPVANASEIVSIHPEHYDTDFVTKFVTFLTKRNKIENIVTIADNRKTDQLPAPQNITHSLEHEFDIWNLTVPIIVCGIPTNIRLWQIVNERTLVIVTVYEFSPTLIPILDVFSEVLDRRHHVYIIFTVKILRHNPPTWRQLSEFFDWCWRNNFLNVVITYQYVQYNKNGMSTVRNELFTYTPFPHVLLINVTRYGAYYPWSAFDAKDVHGYEFYIPVFQDPPSSFLVSEK